MTSSLKLFFNSLCGKNIGDTLGCASCATFLFISHFDVICDLLLNRSTANWNLFVKQRYCYATGTESISSVNQFTQSVLDIFKWIQQFKIQEVFKNTRGGGILLRQAFNYVGILAHWQLMQWSCAQPFEQVFCLVEPSGGSDREKEFSEQHFSKLSDPIWTLEVQ